MEYDVISNYRVSAASQKEQHPISASRRDYASLVKGGGLPQGKPEGFCLPCKGRWVAARQAGGIFLKKIDFKKKVLRCLIPQSSSMTAPFTREPNKGSKLYLSIACATAGFQHTVQIFTNTVEVAVYLIIGNSYNRKSVLFKKFCPFGVIFNSFILVVL